MDLARGAGRLIVTMTHCDRSGTSKVVPQCTLPLTARAVVDVLITDLAVFHFGAGGMRLTSIMPGVEMAQIQAATTAEFAIDL